MAGSLGSIRGQMVLDVSQALSAYTAVRLAHLNTMTALSSGGAALTSAGAGVAATGLLMAAGIGYAVNAAATFERKLDYFGAVSNATQAEYDAIREKAIQLGQDTIYSAGEIADSFVELGKAGVVTKDIIGGIGEGVAALGAAADIPLDTAATIMMSAVQTFQLGADQAVNVADKLAGAANASIIDVQDLGVSLKYAGGVAASLGMDFEEVNTALALLGQYGIRGSTAGTSLRQILVSLPGATKKATKELESLGIITEDGKNKFFDASGSAKDLSEIFQILGDATAHMSDEQRISTFKSIFQSRALSSVIALTQEGAAGFDTMSEAISKTTAMDVANKRLDNLSGDIEILKGNLETLAIESGSQLQEFARSVVQGLTRMIQVFTNLSPETQAFILKAAALVGVGLILLGLFGMLAGSILNIIVLFIRVREAVTLLRAMLGAARVAMLGLNTAFLANPITWIIVAIVALIAVFVLLWKNNEGFRDFMIDMWEKIKSGASAALDWFKGLPKWFSDTWTKVRDATVAEWDQTVASVRAVPGQITGFFSDVASWFGTMMTNVKNFFVEGWNNVVETARGLPGRIGNFFSELPNKLAYWFGFAIGTVIRLLMGFIAEVATRGYQIVTDVGTWLSELPGRVQAWFIQTKDKAVAAVTQMATDVLFQIIAIYTETVLWFQQMPGQVETYVTDMATRAKNKVMQMASDFLFWIISIYVNMVLWFQQLPGKAAEFFSGLYTAVHDWMNNAVATVINMASRIWNGFVDGVKGLPDEAKRVFNNVVQAVKDKVTAAFKAVKDFAGSMWQGFKDGLGIHSPSYIEEAMWTITDVVGTETNRLATQVSVMQGLGNNITELGQNTGLGFNDTLTASLDTMTTQLAQAQRMREDMANLGATSLSGGSLTAPVGGATPMDLMADNINAQKYNGPENVVHQDISIVNPVTERDSDGINRSLQLGAFMMT